MLLVVPGVILTGLAAGFAFASYKIRRIRRFVAGKTETYTVDALTALHREASTGREFSRAVEIAGRLRPAASGPLISPYGEVRCVWHRHVVTRQERSGDDDPEIVDEGRSGEVFAVDDGTGRVLVDPRGSEPFGAVEVVDRWEQDTRHRYREWALLVDTPVSVRGEASERQSDLVIHRPTDESVFVIAAESREGIAKLADKAFRHRLPLCVAMALVGAAMIAVGLALG